MSVQSSVSSRSPAHVWNIFLFQHPLTWPGATVGRLFRAVCNSTSFLSSSFPSAFFCWSVAPDRRKSTAEEEKCFSKEHRPDIWQCKLIFSWNRRRLCYGKYGGSQSHLGKMLYHQYTPCNWGKYFIYRWMFLLLKQNVWKGHKAATISQLIDQKKTILINGWVILSN